MGRRANPTLIGAFLVGAATAARTTMTDVQQLVRRVVAAWSH